MNFKKSSTGGNLTRGIHRCVARARLPLSVGASDVHDLHADRPECVCWTTGHAPSTQLSESTFKRRASSFLCISTEHLLVNCQKQERQLGSAFAVYHCSAPGADVHMKAK
mmetsp:Transcript_38916/g.81396  ORF Transcript_38916/g.81396 Transcript_38916/m.81396 type:complete len:110 (-) Transcript_38916:167-496(-)